MINKNTLKKLRHNKSMANRYQGISNVLYISGVNSNNKQEQITSYLLHNINPDVNFTTFNKHKLAKKFNCSQMTVSRAINLLKDCPYVKVVGNSISLKVNKGGADNG